MDSRRRFNVVISNKEKLGGLPVTIAQTDDFKHCIKLYKLEDPGFKGSKYTWWNGIVDKDFIFKRLDRFLWNDKMQSLFPVLEVEYLTKSGLDYDPLLFHFSNTNQHIIKAFRFLNFWLKEESCLGVIRQN